MQFDASKEKQRDTDRETFPSPPNQTPHHEARGTLMTDRDVFALRWIGQQYAIRRDQLQRVLSHYPGHGLAPQSVIGEHGLYDVVKRWEKAEWVSVHPLRANAPSWIGLTTKGMKKIGVSYPSRPLDLLNMAELEHLYAINEVRLQDGDGDESKGWISERMLVQGTGSAKGQERVHRPDAVLYEHDDIIAIEVELSKKTGAQLSMGLLEMIRDEDSHEEVSYTYTGTMDETHAPMVRADVWGDYTHIRYYAPLTVRMDIRRVRASLVKQGRLSEEEAMCISIHWYPLTTTVEEQRQEKQEDEQ